MPRAARQTISMPSLRAAPFTFDKSTKTQTILKKFSRRSRSFPLTPSPSPASSPSRETSPFAPAACDADINTNTLPQNTRLRSSSIASALSVDSLFDERPDSATSNIVGPAPCDADTDTNALPRNTPLRSSRTVSTSSVDSLFDELFDERPNSATSSIMGASRGTTSLFRTFTLDENPYQPASDDGLAIRPAARVSIHEPEFDHNFSGLLTKRTIARRYGHLKYSTKFSHGAVDVEITTVQAPRATLAVDGCALATESNFENLVRSKLLPKDRYRCRILNHSTRVQGSTTVMDEEDNIGSDMSFDSDVEAEDPMALPDTKIFAKYLSLEELNRQVQLPCDFGPGLVRQERTSYRSALNSYLQSRWSSDETCYNSFEELNGVAIRLMDIKSCELKRLSHEVVFGPSGLISPEDVECALEEIGRPRSKKSAAYYPARAF